MHMFKQLSFNVFIEKIDMHTGMQTLVLHHCTLVLHHCMNKLHMYSRILSVMYPIHMDRFVDSLFNYYDFFIN